MHAHCTSASSVFGCLLSGRQEAVEAEAASGAAPPQAEHLSQRLDRQECKYSAQLLLTVATLRSCVIVLCCVATLRSCILSAVAAARGAGADADSAEARAVATGERPRLLQVAPRGDQAHRERVQAQVSPRALK